MFKKAMECYVSGDCEEFESLHMLVTSIESEADSIKRNIRGHLPRGLLMPVDKFQFIWYLREQDQVMDSMQDTLHWLSYRPTVPPDSLVEDFMLMVDKAAEVIDQIPLMVQQGIHYFRSFSSKDRDQVKKSIHLLRQKEFESDQIERKLNSDIFSCVLDDEVAVFHLIRLIELMGDISDHAENAGDMLRVMIAR